MKTILNKVYNKLKKEEEKFQKIIKVTDYEKFYEAPAVAKDNKKLIISFSSGLSGHQWMTKVFTSHENCCGGCERFTDFDAFFRYVTWNDLPIDMEGFYNLLRKAINWDWNHGDISIQASPDYSFGVELLYKELQPDFLTYQVRKPENVINSIYTKNLYKKELVLSENDNISGPQPLSSPFMHHSFTRILPKGDEKEGWNQQTTIGKITWFYKTMNLETLKGFKKANLKPWMIKLEDVDQNYEYYRVLAKHFGLNPVLSENDFLSLKDVMVNKNKKRRTYDDWSKEEKEDFERNIKEYYEEYDKIVTSGL